MNRKIKLLLMIFIVLVLSCDKPEPVPIVIFPEDDTAKKPVIDDTAKKPVIDTSFKVGGPCIYDTIDVYAVVDSVKGDKDYKKVYFSVFTKSENERQSIYPYVKILENSDYCTSSKFISVGDTILGVYLVITNGGCQPDVLKLLDGKEKCFYK